MLNKKEIVWDKVETITLYKTTNPLSVGDSIVVKYLDNESVEIFTKQDIYQPKPLPKEEVLTKLKLDSQGKVEPNHFAETLIKRDYPRGAPPAIREGDVLLIPIPGSTWVEDEKEKQEILWRAFKEEVEKTYNDSKSK